MATTSTVMKSSAMMNCSQQQQQRSSSLSSRRISSSSKRSIGVSLNRRKQNSSSSSRKETVVVSASSAKIKVVGCGGGGGNAVNRMIEAGVSVSLCVERIALRSCFLHKALALSTTTIRNRRNCLRTSLSLSLSHSSRAFFTLAIDRSSTCCCFCVARRCSASIYRRDLTV